MAAITAAEIVFRYSTTSGTAGNSLAGTAAGSLGKYISTTAWVGGAANDLFDDITGAENAASTVDYRCIFVYNANTANALQNAVVYLTASTAGGATISLAADTTAASALAATSAQAGTIANETTAPTTIGTWTTADATGTANGVSLGSIPAGQVKAFWIRRTATNSAALSTDGCSISVTGDTGSL
jgi:hypothetical protein